MKNTNFKYKLNFKTMKKGLLTLLAASLVFVGCQNYDDQFDDLNAQISALKSQVDGLSSLSAQVASLSGSISGLQAGIAASASSSELSALSTSLTALQSDIDSIEAAIATTASASEVAALSASLTAVETDLAELLTTSNVYTVTTLTIGNAAQLEAALALGNKLNIVNGAVDIDQSTTMDATKLQTVVDRIFTVTGAFAYDAGANTVTPPTFDKVVSTGDLSILAAGDISFKALTTAGTITLTDTYTTKVTSIDFGALTSVTAFQTDSSSNVDEINFASVTNLDLGSLPYYTNAASNNFDVDLKTGATLDISSMDDVTAAGAAADYNLVFDGPAEVNISNMVSDEGSISLTDVGTATISGFKGLITIAGGTKNVVFTDTQRVALSSATALETVSIDIDLVDDTAISTANLAKYVYAGGSRDGATPSLSFSSMANLTSVALTGKFNDLTFSSLTNLTSIDIDAQFDALSVTSNANLTTFDVTGSEFSDVTFTGNTGITAVEFDHTTDLTMTGSTTADGEADVVITGNTEMAELTFSATKVSTFTVTGNTKMAKITATGLSTVGSDAPDVDIYNNALTGTASDTDDGVTQYNAGSTASTNTSAKLDLGSYTTTSGMDTLKAYMDALVADSDSDAVIKFDTITDYVIATGAVGDSNGKTAGTTLSVSSTTDATKEDKITSVLELTKAEASNATPATKGKEAFAFTTLGTLQFAVNGTNVPASPLALTGNSAVDAANLATTANINLAAAAGVTMTAADTYGSYIEVLLIDYANNYSGSPTGERYTAAQLTAAVTDTGDLFETGHSDEFSLTITDTSGVTNTVTASLGGQSVTGSAIADIEEAIVKAWEAKYGAAGTASWTAIATMIDTGTGTLDIRMLQEDSGGNGAAVSFSVADKDQVAGLATQTSANIDYKIGATLSTSDNTTKSTDTSNAGLIVTFESSLSGVTDTVLTGITSEVANTSAVIASSTDIRTSYSTATGITSYAATGYARTDVRNVEAAVASTAAARIVRYRAHWLGT